MKKARRFAFVETWALLGFLVGLVLAGVGCEVFDPSLYQRQDAGQASDGGTPLTIDGQPQLQVQRR